MYFQKSYEVVGFTFDADIYCVDCLPCDPEDEDVTPIFADSEFDFQPCCRVCGAEIDCMVISYGEDDTEGGS